MGLPEIEGSAPQTEAQHEQKYKTEGILEQQAVSCRRHTAVPRAGGE